VDLEKDFRNTVVINYGYVYSEVFDENLMEMKKEFTKDKWFDYVVSDDVIGELKHILENDKLDNSKLKRIVYDDVINARNLVYSSFNEEKAIDRASVLSENCIVLKLQ
jgi:hypothetical protein